MDKQTLLKISGCEKFLQMAPSAQALYFHLVLGGIIENGIIINTKALIRYIGASESDLETLVKNNFLLKSSEGYYCINDFLIDDFFRGK